MWSVIYSRSNFITKTLEMWFQFQRVSAKATSESCLRNIANIYIGGNTNLFWKRDRRSCNWLKLKNIYLEFRWWTDWKKHIWLTYVMMIGPTRRAVGRTYLATETVRRVQFTYIHREIIIQVLALLPINTIKNILGLELFYCARRILMVVWILSKLICFLHLLPYKCLLEMIYLSVENKCNSFMQ